MSFSCSVRFIDSCLSTSSKQSLTHLFVTCCGVSISTVYLSQKFMYIREFMRFINHWTKLASVCYKHCATVYLENDIGFNSTAFSVIVAFYIIYFLSYSNWGYTVREQTLLVSGCSFRGPPLSWINTHDSFTQTKCYWWSLADCWIWTEVCVT